MKAKSLQDFFVDELKDLYSAEKQLTKALPKMAKAASNDALREAFESHLEETLGHVERLEQIFEQLEVPPRGKKCEAMEGLVEEGKQALDEEFEEGVLDAALICAAQRIEHYEIAGYGCVRTLAEQLGFQKEAKLLQQTLEEEGAADKKLTQIAMEQVNQEAVSTED